ncbi:hypothetical protein [Breoghania sp.]|uniref:hypothetical protein n=1 Tax=Breoghania sp. TaxID=2065378 RepID=UPI002620F59B|nr:hypothetical protein [Breoghania sp.]MDJ0930202.1 hypothetical protein [Breoghania sp.]
MTTSISAPFLSGGTFYLVSDASLRAELEKLGGTTFTYARGERLIEVARFVSVPD